MNGVTAFIAFTFGHKMINRKHGYLIFIDKETTSSRFYDQTLVNSSEVKLIGAVKFLTIFLYSIPLIFPFFPIFANGMSPVTIFLIFLETFLFQYVINI